MSSKRKVKENSPELQEIQKRKLKSDQQYTKHEEGSSNLIPESENVIPGTHSLEKFNQIKKLWFQVGETGELVRIEKLAIDSAVSDLKDVILEKATARTIKLPENYALFIAKVAGEDDDLGDPNEGTKLDEIELRTSKNIKKAFAPLQDVDVIDQVLIRLEGNEN